MILGEFYFHPNLNIQYHLLCKKNDCIVANQNPNKKVQIRQKTYRKMTIYGHFSI